MAEQVRIDITAEDKASKPIDAVADKVKGLEKADATVKVEADTTAVGRDMDQLMSKVDKLASAPATLLLTSNAKAIASDIAGLTIDLDKLDSADPTVEVKAAQINALSADLEQIEAKLRSVNDVEVSPKVDTGPAQHNLHEMGKSADSAASVTANAVGNLSQDVTGLAGVTGSAGVAFGQMGEYMTEAARSGEGLGSVMKNFGKEGLAIAAVTVMVSLFSAELEKSRKATEANKKQADDMFKAFSDGAKVVDVFRKAVAETGKLEFGGLGDVLPKMDALNISVNEFARLSQLPEPQLKAWADEQRKLTGEGTPAFDQLRTVVFALGEAHQNTAEAEARHQSTVKALGDDTERYNAMVADQHAKLTASTAATDLMTARQQANADMLDRVNTLLTDQATALGAQADAATTAADAQISENDLLERFGEVLGDSTSSVNDQRDAAIALAKAHVTTADAQAKAAGETLSATAKIDAQNDALLTTAATAKGEARNSVLAYIGSVNQIPPEKLTDILALIDQGRLDEAKTAINNASAPRTVSVRADADTAAAESELGPNGLTRPRTVDITARVRGGSFPGSGQANAPMPSMIAPPPAATVTNVSVNVPRGTRPDDVVAAADRYARRNGRPRAVRR